MAIRDVQLPNLGLTHREAEFHNLPPCGLKIRDSLVQVGFLAGF